MDFSEVKLKNVPEDSISAVKFGTQGSQYLIASSWDSTLRFYDVTKNLLRQTFTGEMLLLDVEFMTPIHVVSGSLDKKIRLYDINARSENVVGSHEAPVKCVEFVKMVNGVMTGSWDKTMKLWDIREKHCVGTYDQKNGKVYSMSVNDEKIVVATSELKVLIWDLRNMGKCIEYETPLKSQLRCIRIFPNKDGYVMSSIDGRVAVEYFNMDTTPKTRFQFKCHRELENSTEYIYPVNAISFHKVYNTFATGGSDCIVNIWDSVKKKRICQLHKYDTSITYLDFSGDGGSLAIACSFMDEYDAPPDNVPKPAIYVRSVNDSDTKPK